MNYLVKFPDGVVYEYSAAEIRELSAQGRLPEQCLIQEKGFLHWVSVRSFLGDSTATQKPPPNGGSVPAPSKAMKRYRDAYLVANVTDGLGKIVQGLGIMLGGLVFLGILFYGLSIDYPMAGGFTGLLLGGIVAISLYVLGVLVAANGQMLKASLDSAVNDSPFLSLQQKAQVMSLD